MNGLRIGSLFSGIGGLELGLERAGVGQTVWQCEIDPWARKVLAKHWPEVPCHDDVATFHPAAGSADLICFGFPCQDVSKAGRGEGLEGARSGLWKEGIRVVREVRPRYVLVENVERLLDLGFGTVLGDLAASGYDAEWDCIPAAAVGAPHPRDRVFILAYANGGGHLHRETGELPANGRFPALSLSLKGGSAMADAHGQRWSSRVEHLLPGEPDLARSRTTMADTDSLRQPPSTQPPPGEGGHDSLRGQAPEAGRREYVEPWPGSAVRQWAVEPDVGRVVDGVPSRVDRLRGLGNAVVPQVAEFWGWRIRMIEESLPVGKQEADR